MTGRLDKLLYVPLPNAEDRLAILQTQCRKLNLAADVDLVAVANDSRCKNFSGDGAPMTSCRLLPLACNGVYMVIFAV